MIAVIDCNTGNTGSVANMIKKIGRTAVITSNPDVLRRAECLVLPGVGTFDSGMEGIREHHLLETLNQRVKVDKVPFLGICLGMQLLTEKSEEGDLPGLGWVSGVTRRFDFGPGEKGLPVPHMGWNSISVKDHTCHSAHFEEDTRFYFVHSYHVECTDRTDVFATSHYGYDFASIIRRDNILGVQFHPEKSHQYGMRFLKDFFSGAFGV